MKTAINSINKPLIAVAYLSRFDWFNVSAEDTTGKTSSFCATKIYMSDDSGYFEFERQFANPKYSNGKIEEVIPVSETKFLFLSKGGTVYTVEATNKALADCSTASGSKEDPASLIDWSRSLIDETGKAFVVLDLRKLGITPIVSRRIAHYINAYMGGYADCFQVCRTIYFQEADNGEIYSGVYNLETEKPVTKVLYDATYLNLVYDAAEQAAKASVRQMMKEAGEKLGEVIPLF